MKLDTFLLNFRIYVYKFRIVDFKFRKKWKLFIFKNTYFYSIEAVEKIRFSMLGRIRSEGRKEPKSWSLCVEFGCFENVKPDVNIHGICINRFRIRNTTKMFLFLKQVFLYVSTTPVVSRHVRFRCWTGLKPCLIYSPPHSYHVQRDEFGYAKKPDIDLEC